MLRNCRRGKNRSRNATVLIMHNIVIFKWCLLCAFGWPCIYPQYKWTFISTATRIYDENKPQQQPVNIKLIVTGTGQPRPTNQPPVSQSRSSAGVEDSEIYGHGTYRHRDLLRVPTTSSICPGGACCVYDESQALVEFRLSRRSDRELK